MSTTRRSLRNFRIPIALALLSAAGLNSALLGDGPWDALSWLALSIPLAACAVILFRPRIQKRR